MSNLDRPWGGEPPGHPTEQSWHAGTPQAGQPSPGGDDHARPASPGLAGDARAGSGWASRWTLGIVAACLLTVGAVTAVIALTGHSAPTAAQGPAGGTTPAGQAGGGQAIARGPTGQAALLNATLAGASAPGPLRVAAAPAAAHPGVARVAGPGRCARLRRFARLARRSGLRRLARRFAAHRCHAVRRRIFRFFLLRGVDGQFTFRTRDGLRTRAFQRGVIESVTPGSSLVVKDANGAMWTWHLTSATVVRDRAGKVGQGSLSDGEPIWAGGPVVSGAKDAALIIIRPPGAGG